MAVMSVSLTTNHPCFFSSLINFFFWLPCDLLLRFPVAGLCSLLPTVLPPFSLFDSVSDSTESFLVLDSIVVLFLSVPLSFILQCLSFPLECRS